MEQTKEEVLDYINTNGFFTSYKLNRIFIGPLILINPLLPRKVGLLLYIISHSYPTQNTHNIKLNKLEAPLPTLEVPQELQYPHQPSLTQQPTQRPTQQPTQQPIQQQYNFQRPAQQQHTLQQNGSTEYPRGVVIPKEGLNKTLREELDKTLKEEPNKTHTDISRNQQVDSSGN